MEYFKKGSCCYVGDNYAGWQRQKNAVGVQNVIEATLSKIYNENVLIFGAGRTDTGVHALAQVFHFHASKDIENNRLEKGLNALLPEDITINFIEGSDSSFHAMRSAISKTYLYKIYNSPKANPFLIKRALWIRNRIDIERLKSILACFISEHDFASFCVKKTKKENTIRKINFIEVKSFGEYETGKSIEILINANGFLHNMVRIIIGTALDMLSNEDYKEFIENIFLSCDRRAAGKTAAAYGLYLKEILY